MAINNKHNKVITIGGAVVTTLVTYAIYVAILGVVGVGLLQLGVFLGEWVHNIVN